MKPVADTGLLVGFLDASDQYHAWAAQSFDELRFALTTCEAVIAEAEYLAPGSGPLLMEMVERGTLQIMSLLPKEAGRLAALQKNTRACSLPMPVWCDLAKSFPTPWSIRPIRGISRFAGGADVRRS